MSIEQTILSSIIDNEEYSRRVLPHIKPEYFQNEQDKQAFILIKSFFDKYNKTPTKQALLVDLDSVENISETVYKGTYDLITGLPKSSETTEWLVDKTEKFCQDKALYNAILESIQIMDNKKSDIPKTAIPKILQDALAVSLETKLGHDYLEDAESRFDFYHNKVSRIPFDIEILNKITKGGVPKKTLNIILSPTNTGKTLIMCHMASAYLKEGKNVLYITLEMAEEEISKRIDANLLNVPIDDLMLIDKANFVSSIQRIKSKYKGRLKVVEYPTSTASAAHFRHLLSELKAKEEFIPDVIFIDYINLCASSRLKSAAVANTFLVVKSVAEEIRGLAVESLATIWSATQTTRTGLCLDPSTIVTTKTGSKRIGDLTTGEFVLSNDGWNKVVHIFPETKKKMFKITTESGKEIIASEDHLFPVESGKEKNIKNGLCLQDKLQIYNQ